MPFDCSQKLAVPRILSSELRGHLLDDRGLLLGRECRELTRQIQDPRIVHARIVEFLDRHSGARALETGRRVSENSFRFDGERMLL